jgi:hypothetical protein
VCRYEPAHRKSANMNLSNTPSVPFTPLMHPSHPLSPPLTPSSRPLLLSSPLIHSSHSPFSHTPLDTLLSCTLPHMLLSYTPLIHSILSMQTVHARLLPLWQTTRIYCRHQLIGWSYRLASHGCRRKLRSPPPPPPPLPLPPSLGLPRFDFLPPPHP